MCVCIWVACVGRIEYKDIGEKNKNKKERKENITTTSNLI